MLKDILFAIERDKILSKTRLAREFKVTVPMIDDAIDQLLRMGYLVKEETGNDCVVSCGSCPMASQCGKDILTTYVLSDKGRALLAQAE